MAHLTDKHLEEIFTAFVEAEINTSDGLFGALTKSSEKTVADLKGQFRRTHRDIEGFDVNL